MSLSHKTLGRALAFALALLALITLLPYRGASDLSALGYKAFCPFAPMSTILSLYISLTLYRYLNSIE